MPKCPKCLKAIDSLRCQAISEEGGSYFLGAFGGQFDGDSGSTEYSGFSCPECGEELGLADQEAADAFLAG